MKRSITRYAIFTFSIIILGCMTIEGNFEDFTYESTSNGLRITRYTGLEKDVVIPSSIKGKNVTEIWSLTYSANMRYFDAAKPKNTTIQSITIPETVKNIYSDAFEDCESLETIILQNNDIQIFRSGLRTKNKISFVYYPELIDEEIIFNNNRNVIRFITRYTISEMKKIPYITIFYNKTPVSNEYKIEARYNGGNSIISDKPIIEIIKNTDNDLYYKIIVKNNDFTREFLCLNENIISPKEYSKIYDIRYGTSDNLYYIGDIPNRTTRDFCRNSEVLGQNIQEYIISNDGLQYAFVKIGGVQIRGRDYLWHSSAIFLNGNEYYHSSLDRSIFINYHIFHPNGRSIIYYYIDSTNENNSLYYFNINTNTYGPYAYIDKDSCIISDDQQYFIFKQKKNSIYDKWTEEKIVLK